MLPPLLLAIGFESWPMLYWLAAAAAPWLIHLLSRRKHRETAWAAMTFLLAAAKRRTRRIRIEQWLLLLVRTLVVATLVMAVAEPYLEHALPVFGPNGSTHRVLVIDSSYSMGYKAADRTRFEQAKQWASRIIEKCSPGDAFTLVQMASPPRVIVATPGLEAGPVQQEIQNLELLHTGADLAATLGEVRKVLDTAHRDSPRLTRHEVYFFTDLQRGTWLPAMNEAKRVAFRSRTADLARLARIQVIDLGQPGDDNLAVTSLDLREPVVVAGQSVNLEAGVRDFGHVARQRQTVELLVDGSPAGKQYVDIPAGGSAVARFSARFESAGDHAVEVRLVGDALKPVDVRSPADALEVDNHRYLVVNVRQAIRVLCVDGRPSGDPRKASVLELVAALSSQRDPKSRPLVDVRVATESAVLERDLGQYDCVMLSDVAQFTGSEARVMDNYLAHGGSLVFFLGDRVKADNYNHVLAVQAPEGSRPILPARLIAVAKNPGGRLDPLNYRHPIVASFRNQERTQMLESIIYQYFKVELTDEDRDERRQFAAGGAKRPSPARSGTGTGKTVGGARAEVALALSNGDPLIVAQSARRGRVVLVTTSADTTWGLFQVWGYNYTPLVKQILAWCIAGQSQPGNVEVGDALESAFPAISTPLNVSVERPGGQRRAVPLELEGDYSSWRYDDTWTSGIYTARLDSPQPRKQLFAVNVLTAESDLSTISRDELQNDVWPDLPIGYETSWRGDGPPVVLPSGSPAPLHVGMLWAVVALLLLETILAWRFGYSAS
jgi:hypothetical protein